MTDMHFITCDPLIGLPRVPPANGLRSDAAEAAAGDGPPADCRRTRTPSGRYRERPLLGQPYADGGNCRMCRAAPVWALTPDGESPRSTRRRWCGRCRGGVRTAWMSPAAHAYTPAPWCCGELFAALAAAGVPLLVSFAESTAIGSRPSAPPFPACGSSYCTCHGWGATVCFTRCSVAIRNCTSALRRRSPCMRDTATCATLLARIAGCWAPVFRRRKAARASAGCSMRVNDAQLDAVAHGNIERLLAEVRHDL